MELQYVAPIRRGVIGAISLLLGVPGGADWWVGKWPMRDRAGMTRAEVESGKLWLFEMAPPSANMTGGSR